MPNKYYRKGTRKEYKICKQLRDKGFDIAQRSAGSHSPIDVFAIDIKNRKILLIQAKPDDYKKKEYSEYENKLRGKFEVKFKVK